MRASTAEHRAWAFYLDRYHYLGLRVVGENIGYVVRAVVGGELACLLFGAAAWCCGPRDRALGWGRQERQERLSQIANNTRFLILPWVKVPHLASHVLGRVARRIDRDWRGVRAWLAVVGNVCRTGTFCGHLLPGGQLAMRGPNPRAQPSGPRALHAGAGQGRLPL